MLLLLASSSECGGVGSPLHEMGLVGVYDHFPERAEGDARRAGCELERVVGGVALNSVVMSGTDRLRALSAVLLLVVVECGRGGSGDSRRPCKASRAASGVASAEAEASSDGGMMIKSAAVASHARRDDLAFDVDLGGTAPRLALVSIAGGAAPIAGTLLLGVSASSAPLRMTSATDQSP